MGRYCVDADRLTEVLLRGPSNTLYHVASFRNAVDAKEYVARKNDAMVWIAQFPDQDDSRDCIIGVFTTPEAALAACTLPQDKVIAVELDKVAERLEGYPREDYAEVPRIIDAQDQESSAQT